MQAAELRRDGDVSNAAAIKSTPSVRVLSFMSSLLVVMRLVVLSFVKANTANCEAGHLNEVTTDVVVLPFLFGGEER